MPLLTELGRTHRRLMAINMALLTELARRVRAAAVSQPRVLRFRPNAKIRTEFVKLVSGRSSFAAACETWASALSARTPPPPLRLICPDPVVAGGVGSARVGDRCRAVGAQDDVDHVPRHGWRQVRGLINLIAHPRLAKEAQGEIRAGERPGGNGRSEQRIDMNDQAGRHPGRIVVVIGGECDCIIADVCPSVLDWCAGISQDHAVTERPLHPACPAGNLSGHLEGAALGRQGPGRNDAHRERSIQCRLPDLITAHRGRAGPGLAVQVGSQGVGSAARAAAGRGEAQVHTVQQLRICRDVGGTAG